MRRKGRNLRSSPFLFAFVYLIPEGSPLRSRLSRGQRTACLLLRLWKHFGASNRAAKPGAVATASQSSHSRRWNVGTTVPAWNDNVSTSQCSRTISCTAALTLARRASVIPPQWRNDRGPTLVSRLPRNQRDRQPKLPFAGSRGVADRDPAPDRDLPPLEYHGLNDRP
jgi:hypothetical protein